VRRGGMATGSGRARARMRSGAEDSGRGRWRGRLGLTDDHRLLEREGARAHLQGEEAAQRGGHSGLAGRALCIMGCPDALALCLGCSSAEQRHTAPIALTLVANACIGGGERGGVRVNARVNGQVKVERAAGQLRSLQPPQLALQAGAQSTLATSLEPVAQPKANAAKDPTTTSHRYYVARDEATAGYWRFLSMCWHARLVCCAG
jgi:hypothetical protein